MSQTNTRKALGKGLEQLFNSEMDFNTFEKDIVENTNKSDIVEIEIADIRSNPYQPRTHFDEEALKELAESIKEHGLLEPIIVKKSIKGYELVAGERRTKASKLAGLKTIPAIIKDFNDLQMMELALIENIQREDLSAIEEANAYKKFIDNMGYTQEELANRFNKSRTYITNLLGLLKLPVSVQNMVMDGSITSSHARVLSKMEDENEIIKLAERIKNESLTVRDIEDISRDTEIPKRKQIKKEEKDLKLKIYENTLRDVIGTKVKVSKNKVVIPFDSNSDLDRIMEILNINIGD